MTKMTEAEQLAQALRYIRAGIDKALKVLDPQQQARPHVLSFFDEDTGLTVRDASKIMRQHGYDPRQLGVLARFGLLLRDAPPGYDPAARYYLTRKGAARLLEES